MQEYLLPAGQELRTRTAVCYGYDGALEEWYYLEGNCIMNNGLVRVEGITSPLLALCTHYKYDICVLLADGTCYKVIKTFQRMDAAEEMDLDITCFFQEPDPLPEFPLYI